MSLDCMLEDIQWESRAALDAILGSGDLDAHGGALVSRPRRTQAVCPRCRLRRGSPLAYCPKVFSLNLLQPENSFRSARIFSAVLRSGSYKRIICSLAWKKYRTVGFCWIFVMRRHPAPHIVHAGRIKDFKLVSIAR